MAEFKVALKAIIHKDGKILVLKRSCEEDVFAELWDIPGGKIEYGEKNHRWYKTRSF
ncbi:MAG: NUDIX domain-containing protein [Alphaproteobacteria bacterium]|nr:NUDIX domain-containing protein [Alphaproteobacteria bacterium]